MHLLLTYTILGLVTGAVYGIAASGLVLTYTTSGIFNFAQGAMAMLAAFTYWQFRYGWNWPAPSRSSPCSSSSLLCWASSSTSASCGGSAKRLT